MKAEEGTRVFWGMWDEGLAHTDETLERRLMETRSWDVGGVTSGGEGAGVTALVYR